MNTQKPSINWFPGHMAKARREIEEKLKMVDVVIEILDARIPLSSANPMMREILKDKPTLTILNKASLADKLETNKWLEYFSGVNRMALDIDLITDYNVKKVIPFINLLLKDKLDKIKERGILNYKIRALVVGIPNVGKSTFINKMAKKKVAIVGDKPGVTKSQTWIKINDNLDLLDTPGILWPKFEDKNVAFNLAVTGSIKDEILPMDDVCTYALEFLREYYKKNLEERYDISISEDAEIIDIYDMIGKKRQAIFRGGEIDYERVINLIMYDIRHEKIGAITYDRR